jgi:hypothetical protein
MPKMAMKGWALVREPDLPKDGVLKRWVQQSYEFASTLTPKAKKAKARGASIRAG